MRMRKKKNLLPRMERCADYQIKDPFSLKGHWRDRMPEARELRVELGCGKGRFTAGTAAAEPDVMFVAVEMVPDAMVVAMERCAAEGLHNVWFVDANANLLPEFFDAGEVDRLYINFCDPWPGNRHAKRRLTHGGFLKLYRKVLKCGGQIHFKTDNAPLFAWSVDEIPQFGFQLSEVTDDLHANGPVGVMTDYEAKFHALGTPIHRLVATMLPWEEPAEENALDIRRARAEDLPRMLEIYAYARAFMAEHGNAGQWGATHWPPEDLLRRDIESGNSCVCMHGKTVVGTFFLAVGEDIEPSYRRIENGAWQNTEPYGVVHRLASDGSVPGVGQFCLTWAFRRCGHLRVDTHGNNVVMQNLLQKLGFQRRGIIHVPQDNDPRIAYEKD